MRFLPKTAPGIAKCRRTDVAVKDGEIVVRGADIHVGLQQLEVRGSRQRQHVGGHGLRAGVVDVVAVTRERGPHVHSHGARHAFDDHPRMVVDGVVRAILMQERVRLDELQLANELDELCGIDVRHRQECHAPHVRGRVEHLSQEVAVGAVEHVHPRVGDDMAETKFALDGHLQDTLEGFVHSLRVH